MRPNPYVSNLSINRSKQSDLHLTHISYEADATLVCKLINQMNDFNLYMVGQIQVELHQPMNWRSCILQLSEILHFKARVEAHQK